MPVFLIKDKGLVPRPRPKLEYRDFCKLYTILISENVLVLEARVGAGFCPSF